MTQINLDTLPRTRAHCVVEGPDGQKRWVRTEAEKARRKAATDASKVFKDKTCAWCGKTYTPKFQFGTKRWDSSCYCSRDCKTNAYSASPDYKQKKNAARRGNSELHRKEYLRRIERDGGTRWQIASPERRARLRQYSLDNFRKRYGVDAKYTLERRANAAHQRGRRAKAAKAALLTPKQIAECKQIRLNAQAVAKQLGIKIHVDHIMPLRRGGTEHPDNLLLMTAAANLFWGSRIKRCPWPRPENWSEPAWEIA